MPKSISLSTITILSGIEGSFKLSQGLLVATTWASTLRRTNRQRQGNEPRNLGIGFSFLRRRLKRLAVGWVMGFAACEDISGLPSKSDRCCSYCLRRLETGKSGKVHIFFLLEKWNIHITENICLRHMDSNSNNEEKSSIWTAKQNKIFETALAFVEEDRPDRWQIIAKLIGDKTPEEVKKHYEELLEDLAKIESGLVEIPKYPDDEES